MSITKSKILIATAHMNPLKITSACSIQTEIVVDSNPEFADLSNPHGFIYDFAFLVQAQTKSGRRFNHTHTFLHEEDAIKMAKKVEERGQIQLQYWLETYPVYGSEAWESEDIERQTLLKDALNQNDQETIELLS
jgi:hypothetical protein